jgi:siderophore synthetase component
MEEKLDDEELATFKELLMAISIHLDTLTQLLLDKGIITESEFYRKLKQVQKEYRQPRERKM